MKLIVCLDDNDGMLFHHRRQSSDSKLRERIFHITADSRLWMNEYSAKQFAEKEKDISVDEAFLEKADKGDYCFVENIDVSDYMDKIEKVIVYRWNRVYPSDFKFPVGRFKGKWRLAENFDFKGKSHEIITEEMYEL